MYAIYHGKTQISLWCDGKDLADVSSDEDQSNPPRKRKRKDTTQSDKELKEDKLESVFQQLKAKHENKYSGPQLRLWA